MSVRFFLLLFLIPLAAIADESTISIPFELDVLTSKDCSGYAYVTPSIHSELTKTIIPTHVEISYDPLGNQVRIEKGSVEKNISIDDRIASWSLEYSSFVLSRDGNTLRDINEMYLTISDEEFEITSTYFFPSRQHLSIVRQKTATNSIKTNLGKCFMMVAHIGDPIPK